MIKCFEESNEHYDGARNQIHFLSFSTDVSSNKVFTYKEAITQEDAHLFVEAIQKRSGWPWAEKSLDYSIAQLFPKPLH